MNLEKIKKFCKREDIRELTLHPWKVGGFVVATNGHIAIRVAAFGDLLLVDAEMKKNPIPKCIDDAKAPGLELFSIPALPEPHTCEKCNGSGIAHVCEDCDGEGVLIKKSGNEIDCPACKCSGQVPEGNGDEIECWFCDGRGEEPYQAIQIGDGHFDRRYLAMIAALPNARIAPNGPKDVAYFTFDGGDGALMPMRV